MAHKLLIPLYGNDVAPRFDLTTDVMIVDIKNLGDPEPVRTSRIVILPRASADDLSRLILNEKIQTVVCAGIEEEYLQFLAWKGITVLDEVLGPAQDVLIAFCRGTLLRNSNLYSL